ncbi:DMT family transporter [Halorussus amylolyticus]|uniref:DMT family transporter n=1 Tax=Halorussus amylolyticus TaxID=1126242 RepID=UPI0010441E01|nr:EamA family transporter [Halorussus amylolyticus]
MLLETNLPWEQIARRAHLGGVPPIRTVIPTDGAFVGAALAAVAAVAVAVQSLSVRVGTDRGRTSDALVVVLFANVAAIIPAAAILYYPDYAITGRSVVAFVAAGLVGTLFGRIFYYTSIERIGASRSEPLKASQPLHATLVAVLVLGERVTAGHVAGILLIVAGVGLISWETARNDRANADDIPRFALALPLAAAFLFGIEPTLAKLGFAEGTPVLVGLAIKTAAATTGFLLYLRFKNDLPTVGDLRTSNTRWYLLAGAANTAFLLLYYVALSVSQVSVVVPIIQSSPLIVMILSFAFLSRLERVTWKLVAFASLVVLGAVVLTAFA